MINSGRLMAIRELASDLLAKYRIDQPPVDVEAIARHEGFEVNRGSLPPEMSGALYREKGRVVIAVNGIHSGLRQRFTIAHECGHAILHPNRDLHLDRVIAFRRSDLPTDRAEAEANEFAASLLMPEAFLRERVNEFELATLPSPDNRIDVLARDFEVSRAAMTFRLINLKLLSES